MGRNRSPQRQEGNARRHRTPPKEKISARPFVRIRRHRMIGVIARPDDGLHPRSPGSFAQLIRRWNQRCLNSRDKHPKFNQKQQKKSRRKRKKRTYPQIKKQHLRFTNIPTDEKNQHLRRNPQKQKNNINNKSTKRIIGLVASSFI